MYLDQLKIIAERLKTELGIETRIGIDKSNPFPVDGPFIVVSPGSAGMSFSDTDAADEISVDIDFGIVSESSETSGSGVIILDSLRVIDELADTIRETLKSEILPGYFVAQSAFYVDTEQFPLVLGGMIVLFQNDGFI